MKTKQTPAAPPPEPTKRRERTMDFLPVHFKPIERLDLAERLARATQAKGDLEDQKKAMDAEHKDNLTGLELEIKRLSRKLTTGYDMQNVTCEWIYGDPTSAEKTLVRMDTGEVVRVVPMQQHDYQEELPIPAAASSEPSENLVLEPPPNGKPAAAPAAN